MNSQKLGQIIMRYVSYAFMAYAIAGVFLVALHSSDLSNFNWSAHPGATGIFLVISGLALSLLFRPLGLDKSDMEKVES